MLNFISCISFNVQGCQTWSQQSPPDNQGSQTTWVQKCARGHVLPPKGGNIVHHPAIPEPLPLLAKSEEFVAHIPNAGENPAGL